MAQRDLRRVRQRADKLEQARVALRDAILQASLSGESVRDIAPFAGISPSRVYELLREAQQLERDR
jgi:DNA-directed RNA polymerase specialized sigma24 family protein